MLPAFIVGPGSMQIVETASTDNIEKRVRHLLTRYSSMQGLTRFTARVSVDREVAAVGDQGTTVCWIQVEAGIIRFRRLCNYCGFSS